MFLFPIYFLVENRARGLQDSMNTIRLEVLSDKISSLSKYTEMTREDNPKGLMMQRG